MKPIQGSIVALVTPMHEDGSVDFAALRKLIDWHVAEGTDCISVVGTTGESPTVTVDEQKEIIRVTVEHVAGRVPVMAGCGANSTAEAITLARYAREVGANCQLQVVPYYNKPTQEGIYAHFRAIADVTGGDLPVLLYNVPGRASCARRCCSAAWLFLSVLLPVGTLSDSSSCVKKSSPPAVALACPPLVCEDVVRACCTGFSENDGASICFL